MAGREEKKMNILLVGGSCSLMDSMILKLRKEGHRVFLLTGDKYRHNKYERVFEKYDFAYDCENLNDILESVSADVTILMGAFDTNYRWNGEEREIVHFISHLVNILVAYSVVNKGRLIFGIGCGILTFIIRCGSLPEGVSYSILLMNILTPHINRLTAPKPFGWEAKKNG